MISVAASLKAIALHERIARRLRKTQIRDCRGVERKRGRSLGSN
jgi:hypothetical protein